MDAEESIAMVSKPNKECLQEFKDFINIYKKKSSEKSSAYIYKKLQFSWLFTERNAAQRRWNEVESQETS